jgi:hypothetical protein
MDIPYFRTQLVKHKALFRALYNQTQVAKALNTASDESLNFLLKFLHIIATGHVPLHAKGVEAISKSMRESKLAEFESRKYLASIIKSTREQKLKVIRQFKSLFVHILHYVFNSD